MHSVSSHHIIIVVIEFTRLKTITSIMKVVEMSIFFSVKINNLQRLAKER